jgi:hypothetical protein
VASCLLHRVRCIISAAPSPLPSVLCPLLYSLSGSVGHVLLRYVRWILRGLHGPHRL